MSVCRSRLPFTVEAISSAPVGVVLLRPPQNDHHLSYTGLLHLVTTAAHLKQLHANLLRSGAAAADVHAAFLSLATPHSFHYSLHVLRQVPLPATTLYNRLLKDISRGPRPADAFTLYFHMRAGGTPLDRFSFPPLLTAAARTGWENGWEVHGLAAKLGFDTDPFIQTGLVRSYAAAGRVSDARKVFDHMTHRDGVAWNVMIDSYYQAAGYEDVLLLFKWMRKSSVVRPEANVLVPVLSACGKTGNLGFGAEVHSYITANGVEVDEHLQTAFINMYANCGAMDMAQSLYDEMRDPKNLVASTAMIFGFAKAGKLDVAYRIFDSLPEKDLVAWSAIISGYAESDRPNEALRLFNEMRNSGVEPDQITMLSVISACGRMGALDHAKCVEIFVKRKGLRDRTSVRNALIDMYSKCGSLERAWKVFQDIPRRNVISWTSMITGLAMHGDGEAALRLFDRMNAEGIQPNSVTFISLLYACSHAGLVEEGLRIFDVMVVEHNIEPKLEHYGCMIDLLGRAKLLEKAAELIRTMPVRPNVVVWGSLLGAARVHGNLEIGEYAAKKLLELDPDHDGAYVLLSNIYAKANRWGDVGEVRRRMNCRGLLKERGRSWIELGGQVHDFVMGDESHPSYADIYTKLDEVVEELGAAGYVPNVDSVLVDLEEEEKREAVLLHSEKLALSFGLLNLPKGSPVRIAKNLRVCEDCHSFMKLASVAFGREIVLRDRTRFHHFKHGACSCKEFCLEVADAD